MKYRHWLALAATAVLIGACIPSVNPFYTDKDIVFDARLLGEWQDKGKPEDPDVWKFEPSGDRGYTLTVVEGKDKKGKLEAQLFKLKDEWFLDLIPADCDYATNQAGLVNASMFPGHLLVRVTQFEPELQLAFFDFSWLEKYLEKNPKALAHHKEEKRLLLTATTRDLQKFVLKHLGPGELFDKPGEMIRRPHADAAGQPTQ